MQQLRKKKVGNQWINIKKETIFSVVYKSQQRKIFIFIFILIGRGRGRGRGKVYFLFLFIYTLEENLFFSIVGKRQSHHVSNPSECPPPIPNRTSAPFFIGLEIS